MAAGDKRAAVPKKADGEAAGFPLRDIVAALQDELAAAAEIVREGGGPQLMLAKVDMELACAVTHAGPDGLRVALSGEAMKELPPDRINRLRLSIVDVHVASIPQPRGERNRDDA